MSTAVNGERTCVSGDHDENGAKTLVVCQVPVLWRAVPRSSKSGAASAIGKGIRWSVPAAVAA